MPMLDSRRGYKLFYCLHSQWYLHQLRSDEGPQVVLVEALSLLAGRVEGGVHLEAFHGLELWDRHEQALFARYDAVRLQAELASVFALAPPQPMLEPFGEPLGAGYLAPAQRREIGLVDP
jgi:hypothetical protein